MIENLNLKFKNWRELKRRRTERVRRGRGRWRDGERSRSSRGWVVRRRIEKATRSCRGPTNPPPRSLIHTAMRTAELRSFSFPIFFFLSKCI